MPLTRKNTMQVKSVVFNDQRKMRKRLYFFPDYYQQAELETDYKVKDYWVKNFFKMRSYIDSHGNLSKTY